MKVGGKPRQERTTPSRHPWSRAAVFASRWKGYQVVANTNEVQSRLTFEIYRPGLDNMTPSQATTSLSQWVLLHGFGPPVILQRPPWRFGRISDWRWLTMTFWRSENWGRNWLLSTCQVTGTDLANWRCVYYCLFAPSWNPKPASAQQKSKTWHKQTLCIDQHSQVWRQEQVMSSMRQGYRQQQHPPPPSSTALSTWIAKTLRSKIGKAKKIRLPNHWGTAHLAQRNCLLE